MDKLLERFLHYVSLDTQSKSGVRQVPSTEGQWKLLRLLKQQLEEMGLVNITLSEKGTLMATLPANVEGDIPAIGFISHVDTSPDFSGKNVNPQIVENYRGGDIALGIGDEVLSPVMFPVLHQLLGQTLITTDGKTLLGADDKAGVAEIMTALAVLKGNPIPHGDIKVAFTPDEEVGKGAKHFDVEAFGAQWAYTVDGGGVGELEFENFNAASVNIKIVGNNVHPGTAKGVMVNALSLAARIHAEVPADEAPETTEGYEGFYHLASMKGTVDRAEMHYIIRDFDRKQFEARKRKMMEIAKKVGKGLHPDCYIELVIEDSYYNMREKVVEHPHILDIAQQAMRDCHITPEMKPIRGGTDGAQLSFMGLPCPNLFTGGYNYHGKPELTPQMLLRARAIMKTFPADTYPGDRADMFEHLAAFNVYSDDRYIEYSPTEQWRYEIKVDYRQQIAWQEQALTWRLKDKKASTEALVYTLNRMRDAYSDALEERDVECDSARKAYYLAKIDATERQWLSVILRDKTWDNRERVASFLQQKADIAYNAGHISEAINALSQALKIEQTLYGAEFGEMTVDSNNLAGFYAQGHHYKEAKDLYLKLIAYYQSRLTPMATVISRLRFYLPENIDLDSTSLYLPLLAEYKRRQSDVSMVLYGISLLYQSNQELEQAKDFAERAFTLDAVAYPAKMQYERLQQLANIAEGLGDNVLARRYRQMSFRHRMAHSIYPGDPQYNDVAKPGGDRCG
ncbi:TPA: peptidase T [Salmonella enterica subsp. enterica serovar Typhimurium]|nr:peptidase T [Salmonella enterica subsp. enterica serovar Typhimurium]